MSGSKTLCRSVLCPKAHLGLSEVPSPLEPAPLCSNQMCEKPWSLPLLPKPDRPPLRSLYGRSRAPAREPFINPRSRTEKNACYDSNL
jgi:hypothetical protein